MINSGNENNKKKSPQQSPDSAENQVTISIRHPGRFHISVIDSTEKLVYETTIEVRQQQFVLDLSPIHLQPGEYRVEITSDKESHLIKIVKK